MALATTCPTCKTSFKVNPEQLKLRRGLVRCGMCQNVFSGIEYVRYVSDSRAAKARKARKAAAAAAAAANANANADANATAKSTDTDDGAVAPQTVIEDLKTAFFLPETQFAENSTTTDASGGEQTRGKDGGQTVPGGPATQSRETSGGRGKSSRKNRRKNRRRTNIPRHDAAPDATAPDTMRAADTDRTTPPNDGASWSAGGGNWANAGGSWAAGDGPKPATETGTRPGSEAISYTGATAASAPTGNAAATGPSPSGSARSQAGAQTDLDEADLAIAADDSPPDTDTFQDTLQANLPQAWQSSDPQWPSLDEGLVEGRLPVGFKSDESDDTLTPDTNSATADTGFDTEADTGGATETATDAPATRGGHSSTSTGGPPASGERRRGKRSRRARKARRAGAASNAATGTADADTDQATAAADTSDNAHNAQVAAADAQNTNASQTDLHRSPDTGYAQTTPDITDDTAPQTAPDASPTTDTDPLPNHGISWEQSLADDALDEPQAALAETAEDDSEEDAIDFFGRTSKPAFDFDLPPRGVWLAAGALALLLGVQLAIGARNTLAARFPAAKPVLQALSSPIGLEVKLPVQPDAITIESFDLADAPGDIQNGQTRYVMNMLIRNHAKSALRWPAVELTLTDNTGGILVRKALMPADYLKDKSRIVRGMAASSEEPVRLSLAAHGIVPSGYSAILFYP